MKVTRISWIRRIALIGALWCSGAAMAQDGAVVFAAASLRGVLDAAAKDITPPVRIAYGGSGAMAQQLARGAPADLVILASPDWMAWLSQAGHVQNAAPFLGNRLVLIAAQGPDMPAPDAQSLLARLQGGRLAIGQRRAVPAGAYAQAWLQNIGAWSALEPALAEAANVRAALAFVAQGSAPLGIVYATDAQAEPRVQVIHRIPPDLHPPIEYPAAALTPAGEAVLRHLRARAPVFTAAGFDVLP